MQEQFSEETLPPRLFLERFVQALEHAPYCTVGGDPAIEGYRYIQLSETLAHMLIQHLQRVLDNPGVLIL